MSFAAYYKLSSYCLIAAGFLALAATGVLSPLLLALFVIALTASWFVDTARLRRMLPRWIWWCIALAYIPVFFLDFSFLSRSLMVSTLHFVIFMASLKLFTRAADRDFLYLYLLSFVALIAAAALTVDLIFLPCLFLFLVFAISSLILHEMQQSSARAQSAGKIQPFVVPRGLRGTGLELFAGFPFGRMAALTLVMTLAIIILAVPLFFLLPRVSLGMFRHAASRPRFISGFAERVELGAIGNIKESDELVMKIRVDAEPGKLPADLKWRGIALDHFDGKAWSRSRPGRNQIPTQAGYFKLQQTTQGTDVLVQTFFVEPISTDVVFGSHKVLAISSDLGWLERDACDNVYSRAVRTAAIRYTAISDITRPDSELIAPLPGPLPVDVEACCLEVASIDRRVGELAHRVTVAASTPYEKARALENHLRTGYGYSLELRGTPNSADPLAMFLFEVRRGHCEYFATAMAIMLRQLEIPSRLVNGFRAGEYNGLSGHWTVRQKNAHSWVEAYFAPYGWVEFDPTPADPDSPTPAFLKTVAQLFDALDLWWSADVVNYDLRGQSHLVEAGRAWLQDFQRTARDFARQAAGSFGPHLINLGSNHGILSPAGLIVFLASVVILMTYFFFRRPFGFLRRFWRTLTSSYFGRDQGVAVVGFYAEALDLLKKRGWERSRNQTPLEFARDLARQPFGDALISLTAVYNRIRFGQLTRDGDFAEARDLLEDLRAPLRHGMPLERNRPKA